MAELQVDSTYLTGATIRNVSDKSKGLFGFVIDRKYVGTMGGSLKLWMVSNEKDAVTLYLGHKMRIFVEKPIKKWNKNASLMVHRTATIAELKELIRSSSEQKHPLNHYKLTFGGKKLDAAKKLESYGIKPYSTVKLSFSPECTGSGANYEGTLNVAENGKPCLAWKALPDNKERFKHLPSNYCRNPDSDKRPWCYTGKYFFAGSIFGNVMYPEYCNVECA
eukprot:907554_1